MTVIRLINNSQWLTAGDFADLRWGMQMFANQVAHAWGLQTVYVREDDAIPTAWQFHIVDTLPTGSPANALGFHEIVGDVVTAYISAEACGMKPLTGLQPNSPFGVIMPAVPAIGGAPAVPETLFPGSLSEVLAHEIAEALVDPYANRYALDDAGGKLWLVEVCDHAASSRYTVTVGTRRVRMIVPDFTLPSFYDPQGMAPYSFTGNVKARFTLDSHSYGYQVPAQTGVMVNADKAPGGDAQ